MVDLGINNDTLKDIQLVIFDKDGTIMDLYTYWAHMVSYRVDLARETLGFEAAQKKNIMYAMGVDVDNKKLRDEGPVGLKKREIVMQAMVDALEESGFAGTHDLCIEIFNKADRLSVQSFSRIIKPVKGMHQLMNQLHSSCKIAIATTDKTERAAQAMDFLDISGKVDFIIGADKVKKSKPFPDMVELIVDNFSIDKKNSVMIGDAITDVEMGINAGLRASIGVCSGLTTRERFAEKTDYVIEDISEIAVIQ